MTALVARDPAVRRLAVALVRDRATWTASGGLALAEDLWKLAALRRGVRLGLFHLVPSLEESGTRLVLSSQPGPGRTTAPLDLADEVVWNHTRVSDTVPLVGRRGLPADVGWHGAAGAHTFRGVPNWRPHRDLALAALSPGREQQACEAVHL
jgi:hypothetical protein